MVWKKRKALHWARRLSRPIDRATANAFDAWVRSGAENWKLWLLAVVKHKLDQEAYSPEGWQHRVRTIIRMKTPWYVGLMIVLLTVAAAIYKAPHRPAVVTYDTISPVMLRHHFKADGTLFDYDVPRGNAYVAISQTLRPRGEGGAYSVWDDALRGRTLGPVRGRYTWSEALDLLLKSSGCRWVAAADTASVKVNCDQGSAEAARP